MSLQQINTPDKNLQIIQDNVSRALQSLQNGPLSGGNLVSGVALVSGSNKIPHGLQQMPTKWILTDLQAAITVYRVSWDAQFITLNASGSGTVSLWVE